MAKRTVSDQVQNHIPGTEPVKNPKVHKNAVRYFDLMQARKAAGVDEKDAKVSLTELMIEEGIEEYEYGGLKVAVDTKRNVKVTIEGKGESEESGEGEE
jgi:hypothetical protein